MPLSPALQPCCHGLATPASCLWPCPLQVPPPSPEPSNMSHRQFQPQQRMQQTNVALLGRETVGNKVRLAAPSPPPPSPHPQPSRPDSCPSTHLVQEPTGFSLNNPTYVRSAYDPDRDSRYLTTYNQG